MKLLRILVVAGASVCVMAHTASGAPARFWLSLSSGGPAGPEAPLIAAAEGKTRFLHIWAQPATFGAGAYHPVNNNFRRLQNFSLNLVSVNPVVDFVDGTFRVYNPVIGGMPRFQFVFDSQTQTGATGPLVSENTAFEVRNNNEPDEILGLQGFSIAAAGFSGIGPSCDSADPFCAVTNNVPSWLVASVAFQTVQSTGTSDVFLQIGSNGMNHQGQSSALTNVVFGLNDIGLAPVYNAGNPGHRDFTDFSADDPDAQILAILPLAGDYNGDGTVGPPDYQRWRATFGQVVTPDTDADGNGNGIIDAADFVVWRKLRGVGAGQFVAGSGSVSNVELVAAPEPGNFALASLGVLLAGWFLSTRRHSARSPGSVSMG